MGKTVLIPQSVASEGVDYLSQRGYQIKHGKEWEEKKLIEDVKGCDAILLRTALVTRAVIEAEPKLVIVARHGAGYNNVDIEAAAEHGVYVTNAPLSTAGSVAEYTVCMMLMLAKRVQELRTSLQNGDFYYKNNHKGVDVEGKTLGLLGFGGIARAVAKKAALGLEAKVIAYDPYIDHKSVPDYVTLAERDEVFAKADFVSLHTPLTGETRRSVGAREFSLMKKTACLINCSRGEVINEAELIDALRDKTFAAAAIDVFDTEPPEPGNPLLSMENVIATPHIASNTEECMQRMALHAAMEIHRVLSGEKPFWPVNRPVLR